MGILGITNRSENWKTAQTFATYFTDRPQAIDALAKRLLKPMDEDYEVEAGTVSIELYWKGLRDYVHLSKKSNRADSIPPDILTRYGNRFSNLRQEIEKFGKLKLPKDHNYRLSTEARLREKLFNNLSRLEIDVVLESKNHLFIGEAKHESAFGRDGDSILVHQLIREYVMATLLTEKIADDNNCAPKTVVPFVVGDCVVGLKKFQQVSFMISQGKQNRSPGGWLKEENVLSWKCIEKLASSGANNG